MDEKKIHCFYSILAKKHKSHGHFECIKNIKYSKKLLSMCYYVFVIQKFLIDFNDFELTLILQHLRYDMQ